MNLYTLKAVLGHRGFRIRGMRHTALFIAAVLAMTAIIVFVAYSY